MAEASNHQTKGLQPYVKAMPKPMCKLCSNLLRANAQTYVCSQVGPLVGGPTVARPGLTLIPY
eukprot:scaffold67605_cov82-Phaeocystis_antarctica.AAC.1